MFIVGGESLIDLILPPDSAGISELTVHAGGSPYNCALALAKLGQSTGFMCPMSSDWLSDVLIEPLEQGGVNLLLKERVWEPTTLAVVKVTGGVADYKFYRHADRVLDLDTMLVALPEKIEFFQIGGFCPLEADDAAIWMKVALEARRRGATLSFDPNLRPRAIRDWAAYRARLDAFFAIVDMVKVSDDDLKALDPKLSYEQHAANLLRHPHCQLVVVTRGKEGSDAFGRSGARATTGIHTVPLAPGEDPDETRDTVGAGDCFLGGLATILNERGQLAPDRLGRMTGPELAQVLRFGAVVAGLNCATKGCNPPSRSEVDAVLAKG